jgi:succinate dehydrogenase / fumarate reductase iron-sulfur subunit
MATCNQCGERLPEGKNVCPECGAVNTSEGVADVSEKTAARTSERRLDLKGDNEENVTDTARMRVRPEGSPSVIRIKVKRQDSTDGPSRWEEFDVPYRKGINVLTCLMDIQKNPVTADGKKTTPVVWDSNCLEEVCGACSMIINGRVRQGCTALVDKLETPITVAPMTKFPVVRDLMVDRTPIFEAFQKVHAWIDIDGTYDLGPGPMVAPEVQAARYDLSRCMACCCCMEACPQYGPVSQFIGPAALNQVRLFNEHPTGKLNKDVRLNAVMQPGGVTDCGNAQNCVKVCPKEIPLTDSIAYLYRETTWYGLLGWLKK